ncbi:hypothetical protein ACFFX0_25970 [Citricoccus parietis]|uniref:Uncharacterized protein n=1 Tax=Citricoccus parietis TaxID=592307 RepID=A0ABV5G6C9_9MICC
MALALCEEQPAVVTRREEEGAASPDSARVVVAGFVLACVVGDIDDFLACHAVVPGAHLHQHQPVSADDRRLCSVGLLGAVLEVVIRKRSCPGFELVK